MRRYGWICGLLIVSIATSLPAQRRTTETRSSSAVATSTPIMRVTTENPREINLGKPATFVIGVSNGGKTPATGVVVATSIPEHVEVTRSDPQPMKIEGRVYKFKVGDLGPGATRKVTVVAVPKALQPVKLDTTIIFATSTRSSLMVRRPMLAMSAKAPATVVIGERTEWTVRVTNTGDGTAEGVAVTPKLVSGDVQANTLTRPVTVGTIKPGETKEVKFAVVPSKRGLVKASFVTTNPDGLEAKGEASFKVLQALLSVKALGPAIQPIGRDSIYEIVVSNPGDAAAGSTMVTATVPAGLKVTAAAENAYNKQTRSLRWRITTVRPGDNVRLRFRAETLREGDQPINVTARSERVASDPVTHTTAVISRPNFIVTFSSGEELSAIGEPITFRATVVNAGSKKVDDLRVRVAIPEGMEAVESRDYQVADDHIEFPAKTLDSGEKVSLAFRAVGRKAGDHRVRLLLGSAALTADLSFEGCAFCYSEAPESGEQTTQEETQEGDSPRVTNRPSLGR